MQTAGRESSQTTLRQGLWCSNIKTNFSFKYFAGPRNSKTRVQCARGEMSGDCLRRCARPIPRFDGAVQNGWKIAGHELSLHGRLRRSRLLFGGDRLLVGLLEGLFSLKH